jgi:hypothetical protein
MKDYEQKLDKETGEITKEQVCYNKFSQRSIFFNTKTGARFKVPCTKYACKKHGWKRKLRLSKAIEQWLGKQSVIRFWTFTINASIEPKRKQFNRLFRQTWHRFIVELRRSKLVPKQVRAVGYVKVYELHKSGRLHIHCFFNEYIDKSIISRLWAYCIDKVFQYNQNTHQDFPSHLIKLGNSHVKGMRNSKFAANYVAKYVVKMANEMYREVRSWSKSGNVAIFPKRPPSDGNILLLTKSDELICLMANHSILVSTNAHVTDFRLLLEALEEKRVEKPSKTLLNWYDIEYNMQIKKFREYHGYNKY